MLAWNPTDEPIARMVALADLRPHDRNYKRHPVAQIVRLQESLLTFGQPRPISIWRGTILAGHGVYAAARESGWQQIWCAIAPDAWTEERAAAWMVADNETARGAEVDETALAELVEQSRAADIALEALGFDEDALTALLTSIAPGVEPGAGGDEFDTTPEDGPTRCQSGDLWIIRSPDGREHRLIVGDCTDAAVVVRLMGGDRAAVCFTSPPYNMGSAAQLNQDKGTYKRDPRQTKYAGAANLDTLSDAAYTDFLLSATRTALNVSDYVIFNLQMVTNNRVAIIDWLCAFREHFVDVAVWHKTTAAPHMNEKIMNNAFEFLFILSPDKFPSRQIKTAAFSRGSLSNVFSGTNAGSVEHMNPLSDIHGATFPLYVPDWVCGNLTTTGDLVYDSFLGSGTTLIAAHRTGRRCYGIEIECKYADIVLRRCEAEGLTVERVS